MQHSVYIWIFEPQKPSKCAFVAFSTGKRCSLEVHNLHVSLPPSVKTIPAQTKAVMLFCSFGSPMTITAGAGVLTFFSSQEKVVS